MKPVENWTHFSMHRHTSSAHEITCEKIGQNWVSFIGRKSEAKMMMMAQTKLGRIQSNFDFSEF